MATAASRVVLHPHCAQRWDCPAPITSILSVARRARRPLRPTHVKGREGVDSFGRRTRHVRSRRDGGSAIFRRHASGLRDDATPTGGAAGSLLLGAGGDSSQHDGSALEFGAGFVLPFGFARGRRGGAASFSARLLRPTGAVLPVASRLRSRSLREASYFARLRANRMW
jgi:hypothetical protein